MLRASSGLPFLRLRPLRGRLLCLIALPVGGAGRELALVASPTAPHLRRLDVYRGGGRPTGPRAPGDLPGAA